MKLKLQVVAQDHQTWTANEKRAAGESFNFMCLDMSQPPQERMLQPIYYRVTPEEKLKFWDQAFDKTFDVVVQKINQSQNGRVSFSGAIVEAAKVNGTK
jgi:hypothetical protein